MTAFDAAEWSELFVAAAGASAALAGLVFVAVSINVDRILKLPGVANRALQALMQLIAIVLVSLLMLAPEQSNEVLGVEALVIGLALTVGSLLLAGRAPEEERQRGPAEGSRRRVLVILVGTLPLAIAGLSLLAETGGGFYWLLAWMFLAILGAVLNAWVLLVEILR